jgi:hypothetical protein
MITTRFKEVVWTGGICAAALTFYMISQTVAAKRAELASVERKIAMAQQDIRELRTQIDTRGGLAQIEQWNQNVYGLQAPGPEQFAASSVRLVAMTQPQGQPALQLDPQIVASRGAVDKVSFDKIEDAGGATTPPRATPAPAPVPVVEQPRLRTANYVQAKAPALSEQSSSLVHEVALRKVGKPASLGDDFLEGLVEDRSARSRKGKQ